MQTLSKRLAVLILLALSATAALAQDAASRPAAEVLPTNMFKNLEAGKKQTVVVYGTSLSALAAYPKALQTYFDKLYPGLVTVANASASGRNSNWALANLEERVLSKKPDLVLMEFSINDSVTRANISREKSAENLEAMIKALRAQNAQVDIVLQIMSPVWDTPKQPGMTAATDRPEYVKYNDVYREYALQHALPLVDHYPAWEKVRQEDDAKFKRWLPDGTHPIPEGSLAVTEAGLERMLDQARTAAKPTGSP